MSKTKAELVAENKVLKAGMSKTKIKLSEENKILESRVFSHMEYINGLEDEIKRLRAELECRDEWIADAREGAETQQLNKQAVLDSHTEIAKKYKNLRQTNIALNSALARAENTVTSFNKLIATLDDR